MFAIHPRIHTPIYTHMIVSKNIEISLFGRPVSELPSYQVTNSHDSEDHCCALEQGARGEGPEEGGLGRLVVQQVVVVGQARRPRPVGARDPLQHQHAVGGTPVRRQPARRLGDQPAHTHTVTVFRIN